MPTQLTPADMPQAITGADASAPGDRQQVAKDAPASTPEATAQVPVNTEMSQEDLVKELAKVRKEAAASRVKLKEVLPLAEKYQQAEDAKKSELDKAMERIQKLEAEKAASELEATRARVASATGVPVDLLPSGTEEEITAAAKALKKWAEGQQAATPYVPSAGRSSGGDDRDSQARKILGL